MVRGRRLPSIAVLISLTGLLVLAPLTGMGYTQWREANTRYKAAAEVLPQAEALEDRLRLAAAIGQEMLSTTWETSGSTLLADLPSGIIDLLGVDYGDSLESDRLAVDSLAKKLKSANISNLLELARRSADDPEADLFTVAQRYDDVLQEIRSSLTNSLTALASASSAAGDRRVTQAARVAEATADLEIIASGQEFLWAELAAGDYLPPNAADVIEFADSVTLYHERSNDLDVLLPADSELGIEWRLFSSSENARSLLEQYESTVEKYVVAGLPGAASGSTTLDFSNAQLIEVMSVANELSATLTLAKETKASLDLIAEHSLRNLHGTASVAAADAAADRTRTLALLALSTTMVIGAMVVLVTLVARPVRTMADAAHRLSLGQLDLRMSEHGPTEVRIGARALNEALTSLQTVEAQAVALAEERLDDPILEHSAPGELGRSLQAAVSRLADSLTERDNFQRRLAHEAAHDGLTKISNRNAILRHLESALARTRRSSTSLALLFLDIDDFKSINDLYGHHMGDAVLTTVAKRLVTAIRDGDLAGRLGGDEFVVVAEPVASINEAISLSRRVVDEVTAPITFEGVTVFPSVSVGIGVADSDLTADELLRDADLAVYRAKARGKGRIDVCDEGLRGEIRALADLEQAMRDALENDEFVLYYQPTVSAVDHATTGFEALIRWERPGVGLVFPDDFIPAAERSDLIAEIDRWVLLSAARQLAKWEKDPALGAFRVAVNISGRHLGSGTLFDDVLGALAVHDVDANKLVLEVTETALLADLLTAARELAQLREAGVKVALDDFGTGYMSLAHLRGLPVDILKVDRSFVSETESSDDYSLIQLIVDTGHVLGVAITAEGVESESQVTALTRMGVDTLQGFLFGRPVPADRAAELAVSRIQSSSRSPD